VISLTCFAYGFPPLLRTFKVTWGKVFLQSDVPRRLLSSGKGLSAFFGFAGTRVILFFFGLFSPRGSFQASPLFSSYGESKDFLKPSSPDALFPFAIRWHQGLPGRSPSNRVLRACLPLSSPPTLEFSTIRSWPFRTRPPTQLAILPVNVAARFFACF